MINRLRISSNLAGILSLYSLMIFTKSVEIPNLIHILFIDTDQLEEVIMIIETNFCIERCFCTRRYRREVARCDLLFRFDL